MEYNSWFLSCQQCTHCTDILFLNTDARENDERICTTVSELWTCKMCKVQTENATLKPFKPKFTLG